jgi:hypothetical protein
VRPYKHRVFALFCLFAVRMGFDDREIVARAFHRCALTTAAAAFKPDGKLDGKCVCDGVGLWEATRRGVKLERGAERGKGCGLRDRSWHGKVGNCMRPMAPRCTRQLYAQEWY